MKNFYFFIVFFVLISCKKENELQTLTSLTELEYPTGTGHSGDKTTGLLGYGYDATGFCDTMSSRAKILEFPKDRIIIGHPYYSGANIISSSSFVELSYKMFFYPYASGQSNIAILSHIKSLMKLASKTNSIDNSVAIAYYEATWIPTVIHAYIADSEIEAALSSVFKNDITALSPKELITKYGTHVLTGFAVGTKFEILYTCKTNNFTSESLEHGLFNRMNQFIGGTPGFIPSNLDRKYRFTDERMIVNTIGSKRKICQMIITTDYNPDGIHIDYNSVFGANIDNKFIQIGDEGIISLDNFIKDPTKKQEVKAYIENYMAATSVNL